jgi:hypothetical protein
MLEPVDNSGANPVNHMICKVCYNTVIAQPGTRHQRNDNG